jgi:hypothetical protein
VEKEEIIEVGSIGNYYGGLAVKQEDGKYFWSIENWDGYNWEEISEKLFTLLLEEEASK